MTKWVSYIYIYIYIHILDKRENKLENCRKYYLKARKSLKSDILRKENNAHERIEKYELEKDWSRFFFLILFFIFCWKSREI